MESLESQFPLSRLAGSLLLLDTTAKPSQFGVDTPAMKNTTLLCPSPRSLLSTCRWCPYTASPRSASRPPPCAWSGRPGPRSPGRSSPENISVQFAKNISELSWTRWPPLVSNILPLSGLPESRLVCLRSEVISLCLYCIRVLMNLL